MKRIVVSTTVTYNTDYDLAELKAQGITTKKQLLDYAKQNFDENSVIDVKTEIYDRYDTEAGKKKPRKGRSSY